MLADAHGELVHKAADVRGSEPAEHGLAYPETAVLVKAGLILAAEGNVDGGKYERIRGKSTVPPAEGTGVFAEFTEQGFILIDRHD